MRVYDRFDVTIRPLSLYDCYAIGCEELAGYVVSYDHTGPNGKTIVTRRRLCDRHLRKWIGEHTAQPKLPGFE
jgi:hypothetical protein